MATTERFKQRQVDIGAALISVILVAVGLGGQFRSWAGNLFDDAYIYLRYAENLVSGCGLSWNCGGIAVEGFTSPAYLAALAALGFAGLDLEFSATVLGGATWGFGLIGFVLLPFWVRRHVSAFPAPQVALLLALSFATDHQLLAINAASGMEGGLVVLALCLVAALAWRPRILAIVAPGLVLVRPELGLATVLQPLIGREHLRRALLAAVAVFTAVTAVRFAVFHDVFPNTFWAKSGGTSDHLTAGVDYLMTSYSRFPLAALVVLGMFSRTRPFRYLASIVLAWSAYFLWSGGDFYPQARLFAFLVPLAYFVGVSASLELLDRVASRRTAAIVALAGVLALAWFGRGWRDTYDPDGGFGNVKRWAATGRYLNRCLPGASVAAVPIGALAYFSKSPVQDLVGLTDPRLAISGKRARGEEFVVGHERYDGRWSLAREPQVVFFEVHGAAPIDSSQPITLSFVAERALLEHIRESQTPYVAISPQVSPGVYQFLFVRRDVAEASVERASRDCF